MALTNISVSHADTGLVTAEVPRAEQVSPHLVRITLGGEDLQNWRSLGFDRWFRLALPCLTRPGLVDSVTALTCVNT